jgi:hypothetical protein
MCFKKNAKMALARAWIKTWFFDIESEAEYKHSKSQFLSWLGAIEGVALPKVTVMSIKAWIVTSLEKTKLMWLNYHRLYVGTMNIRTTGVAEALYHSMKSGFYAVRSSMSTDTAASTMMDKAQRKSLERDQYIANQIVRNKLWTDMPTKTHLTDYAQEQAEMQGQQRGKICGCQR